ncbi:MAG TPA: hypothetical protein VIV60_14005, partial [Polyangiaceae bacterium]
MQISCLARYILHWPAKFVRPTLLSAAAWHTSRARRRYAGIHPIGAAPTSHAIVRTEYRCTVAPVA